MSAYYNEHDQKAAAWLRELIKQGHIAPGVVDETDIRDIVPRDLFGFTQCHFFAGIGVWSYALRRAGWADDRPVWTASLPCQSFSVAGKGAGKADERHLLPVFELLVHAANPPVIFGEQVTNAIKHEWLDDLYGGMVAEGYDVAAHIIPAAAVGAPHIRSRLWWVAESFTKRHSEMNSNDPTRPYVKSAESTSDGAEHSVLGKVDENDHTKRVDHPENNSLGAPHIPQRLYFAAERLADTLGPGLEERNGVREDDAEELPPPERGGGAIGGLGIPDSAGPQPGDKTAKTARHGDTAESASGPAEHPGPTNGYWRDVDWIFCRDGKWRPVEPRHAKMVARATSGVGHLCDCGVPRDEKEEVNEQAQVGHKADARKVLSPVRHQTGEEEISGRSGVDARLPSQEVLQPEVHGSGPNKAAVQQCEPQSAKSEPGGQVSLRDLREDRESACASQGPRPAEQLGVELDDLMSVLSPSMSLAQLHGDRRTEEGLQVLLESCAKEGLVFCSLRQGPEIWSSVSEEKKNRIRLGFDASRWEIVAPSPLEKGAEARAMRLRGYGNALCAPVAQAFIEAYLTYNP